MLSAVAEAALRLAVGAGEARMPIARRLVRDPWRRDTRQGERARVLGGKVRKIGAVSRRERDQQKPRQRDRDDADGRGRENGWQNRATTRRAAIPEPLPQEDQREHDEGEEQPAIEQVIG